MMMNFKELSEFTREIKKLSKKYKSLFDDLDQFKRIINLFPLGNSKHFNIITRNDVCFIIKARFFCRYLKGSSLRIIYAYHKETLEVCFIELYFKGKEEIENKERIKEYFKNI